MSAAPLVSVVVPTAERPELLLSSLASLLEQVYDGAYEVIVVENGPKNGLAARIEELAAGRDSPAVRHLTLEKADANAARNAGVRAARGDPVCFVDDDVLAPPYWLASLVAGASRHPAIDCFGGPVRPLFEHPPARTCGRHDLPGTSFDEPAEAPVNEVWGGNMAIRRGAFERVGLFREGLRLQQEWEWESRLLAGGGRIVFVPDAWLWHRRGRGDVRTLPLLAEAFRRGYVMGAVGVRTPPHRVSVRIGRMVVHGVVSRCATGFIDAARAFGILLGTGQRAVASRVRAIS